ncbi:DUF2752 domain-containing protein [filamentous cyanobacterium LEGE 11480]|uniref:DUF2752 domain-containing protein n=1 Tax=Romeriopsis navalis LEGE 11480 TaxID=2777977 RepID=A0A928Z4D9_9CYAN|nr:DUF2752 domain-containing protein [Romeriopsis navalis]MBE9031669.1 DUF2752 domain-containing protein [Romeriopsis navalis LEGE 11480]
MLSARLSLSSAEKRQRWLYLALVLIPLTISLLNRWGIRFSFWGCPLVEWVGVPCMAWGLTRSFYATARGDLVQAIDFHLFGPLLVIGLMIATGHIGLELLKGQRLSTFYTPCIRRQRTWVWGFLIIMGYHLTRLVTLQSSGQIQQWFAQSIVGQWF